MPVLPGSVVTTSDAAALAKEAAARLAAALREALSQRGEASLALSGGNTPRPAYEALTKEPGIDWSRVTVLWIDERAVPPTHARSNYRLGLESLLQGPIPAANVQRMLGEAKDLEQAAAAYEATLKAKLPLTNAVPVIDVAVLGMGDDGHTASLFPGESGVLERSRLVIAVPAAKDKDREARLTVTVPVLQAIRSAFLLVSGKAKKGPLDRVASDTGTLQETPSRVYRDVRGALTWIVDEAALKG
jgi:6-phosphogluconolactonase